ncbi:hypothetical protein LBMAG42_01170 [Deltaproteobacteria bacterium]|nr:hypothetical protein LBMAG42_01170 [Deltaproteobacteria bacterium]
MKAALRAFARSTEASAAQVGAVRERLPLPGDVESESRSLLANRLGADAGAAERVRARLAYGAPARTRWVAATAAMAAAILVTFVGAAAMGGAWPSENSPLDTTLSDTALVRLDATPHVALRFAGDGRLGGSEQAPRIEWVHGALSVEVEPNQGVQLSVHTAEAEVRVIGTGFDVVRDARGTRVSVAHGQVAVVCEGGAARVLKAGESAECAPASAAGLLGRAQALRQRAVGDDAVLEAAELGLGAHPDAALAAELTLMRAQSLAALDRHEEAYGVAAAALDAGAGTRQADLEHLAAREGLRAEGCEAALRHLRRLRDAEGASPAELVLLADCAAPTDRAEARAALILALQRGVPAEQQDAVVERLVRVGGAQR